MSKAPAFQFYAQDFLTGVSRFTLEQVGAYIKLLALSWETGPLPLDEEERALMVGVPVVKFRSLWVKVGPKWQETPAGYVNAKLEEVRAERERYVRAQSANGRASAAARRRSTASQPESNDGSTTVQPETNTSTSTSTSDPDPDGERLARGALERLPVVMQPAEVVDYPRGIRPARMAATGLVGRHQMTCRPGTWAACQRGFCVPPFVADEWRNAAEAAGLDVDREILGCVVETLAACEGTVLAGDPVKFWRGAWARRHGDAAAAIAPGRSTAGQTMNAARQVLK